METYFVVLQLPGSDELKFTNDPHHFLKSADYYLNAGAAQIVSIRRDTGVSDDVRRHIKTCNSYKSYLLFYIPLKIRQLTDYDLIMKKASEILKEANYEALVDSDDNFQLVMADYLDINDIRVNYGSGNVA